MINFKELLFGLPRRLAHTYRYNTVPVQHRESVDAHSYHTSLYAILIAQYIEKTNSSVKIDWKFLSTSALIHDIDESENGDVLRHVKRYSSKLHEEWTKMCKDSVVSVSNKLVGCDDLLFYWENDKNPNLLEGVIIAISDFLSVFSYTHDEIKSGNTFVEDTFINSGRQILDNFKQYLYSDHPIKPIVDNLYLTMIEILPDVNFSSDTQRFRRDELVADIKSELGVSKSVPVYEVFKFDRKVLNSGLDMNFILDTNKSFSLSRITGIGSVKLDVDDFQFNHENSITKEYNIKFMTHSDQWPDLLVKLNNDGDYLYLGNNQPYYGKVTWINGVLTFDTLHVMTAGQNQTMYDIHRKLKIKGAAGIVAGETAK